MEISRRSFLAATGGTGGSALLGFLGLDLRPSVAYASQAVPKRGKIFTTICPYCGVGCGLIVEVRDGTVVNIEGDPDHPINEGSLCSKGASLYQIHHNDRRLRTVGYRKPGSDQWETLSWDTAMKMIAERVKKTRDETWLEKDDRGRTVNRADGIACLGGAALDTEECYLLVKAMRTMGLVWIEHQARICHSSTVASLASSFGRGAMTNHWIDMINSDVLMIMGSNAAETHPIAARWIQRAKERGAVVLSADPRYTRTSSFADHYCKFRSGTDIAFVGGFINYALQNDRVNHEYIRHCTNATFIINPEFGFEAGLFTGYDESQRGYDKSTWAYELDENGVPKRDPSMQHPRCVFQLLKKHFARYDVEAVCSITGTPQEDYRKACDVYTSTWSSDRVATWLYAMGTTQHTHATQNIRSYVILQLLLGNVGVAGGGINALRGESNVQGSTDMALLFHILPGYLKTPQAKHGSLAEHLAAFTPKSNDSMSANWWQHYPKYMVSLLKAFWGDHATKDNDFCYDYLGRITGNLSHIAMFEAMYADRIKGLFCFGQNPAVGGPNANKEREALGKLDWLVVTDLWETDTSVFWRRPGVDPSKIKTEVFLLPAAASMEKEGNVVNSGRWAQWRYKAAAAPGEAMTDAWVLTRLVKELKELYAQQGGKQPEAITNLYWEYGQDSDEHGEPNMHMVAAEVNGYYMSGPDKGKQITNFTKLTDDGSTCSGNWLYCGDYVDRSDGKGKELGEGGHLTEVTHFGKTFKTINRMAKRFKEDPAEVPEGRCVGLHPDWTWCWPINRRILYNRASVDRDGQPWDAHRWVIRWNPTLKDGKGGWEGDIPDGGWPPLAKADGTLNPSSKYPFIMRPEGVACLFASALADGPFPEHYEPLESPLKNPMSPQQNDPAIVIWEPDMVGDPAEFPVVATTFRVCEHWQAGAMTRNTPWLVELMPDVFVEMSVDLAVRNGVKTGDWVRVTSKRGSMKARALVTNRFEPFFIGGKLVDQIGIPWHWGYNGLATGDSANVLTPHVGDANTMIPEYKAFLCRVEKEEVA